MSTLWMCSFYMERWGSFLLIASSFLLVFFLFILMESIRRSWFVEGIMIKMQILHSMPLEFSHLLSIKQRFTYRVYSSSVCHMNCLPARILDSPHELIKCSWWKTDKILSKPPKSVHLNPVILKGSWRKTHFSWHF